MFASIACLLLTAGFCVASPTAPDYGLRTRASAPTATVKNGTYSGVHSDEYNQDYFLGLPYALPPVDDLRFRAPLPLNTSWSDSKSAVDYPAMCVGYGTDDTYNTGINPPNSAHVLSEDCLYLNVIKPTTSNTDLPVAVWIHGGGLFEGGTNDERYNLSYIVQNSVDLGTPMIAVSVQYRLSGWGFLGGKEALEGGATNLGFRDQRLALHWVQENIAAFGGDPTKVTIWGESAGGVSVGAHLLAYNGRDDGLFRAAIAESGGPSVTFFASSIPGGYNSTAFQTSYDSLIANTSCATATDTLSCFRALPFSTLNDLFNASSIPFAPMIDGDFMATYQSDQLNEGNFVKVPLLIGTNTDEGSAFGVYGVNSDAEFTAAINTTTYPSTLSTFANTLISYLYPNIQAIGDPSLTTFPELLTPSNPYSAFLGLQARRSFAFFADLLVHGPRRASNIAWSNFGVPSYSYRFDVTVNGVPDFIGATHFQEVAFVFDNIAGLGYVTSPYPNSTEPEKQTAFRNLASQISRSWVGFITKLDPNANGLANVTAWPVYNATKGGGLGSNMVFTADGEGWSSFVEGDTWRAEGIQFISDFSKSIWGK